MRNIIIVLNILLFSDCGHKKYSVEIISMDKVTRNEKAETIYFASNNDTTAFENAVQNYWIKKSTIKRLNKEFEQSAPEPFYFQLMDKNGNPIHFPADISEKLSEPIIKYMKDSVLPKIDTLTPYSKRPNEKTPNIYQ